MPAGRRLNQSTAASNAKIVVKLAKRANKVGLNGFSRVGAQAKSNHRRGRPWLALVPGRRLAIEGRSLRA